MNALFPVNPPERCDALIRAARLRRVAREAARADWYSAILADANKLSTAPVRATPKGPAKQEN